MSEEREERKMPKYKNVNITTDLWQMVSYICIARDLTTAEYLDPILRATVKADFTAEVTRVVSEQNLSIPPQEDPPRKRRAGG